MASPQTIQPATSDTYFSSFAKTSNYSTATALSVGNFVYSGNYFYRSLLTFDFSALVPAGVTITVATLSLYLYSHDTSSEGKDIIVSRLLRTDEDDSIATWNIYKTSNNWGTEGARNSTTDYTTTDETSVTLPNPITNNTWFNWDIKNQIQTSLDTNSGIWKGLIREKNETTAVSTRTNFYSSNYATTSLRPKLYIEYTEPPAATDVTVSIGSPESFASSQLTPTITTESVINVTAAPSIQSVEFSQLASVVSTATDISTDANIQSSAFSQLTPTITTTRNVTVTPSVDSAAFSQLQTVISTIDSETIITGIHSGVLATLTPTVTGQRNATVSATEVVPGANLVAYWKLDETSGTATDATGNGHTGTPDGQTVPLVPTFGTGKINNGLVFYGGLGGASNSYLGVPASTDFGFGTGDFTVAFWVNANNTSGYWCSIDTGYGQAKGFLIEYAVSQKWWWIYFNGGSAIKFTTTLNAGTAYHIILRRIGTNLEMFSNGVSLGVIENNTNILAPTATVTIGKYAGGGETLDGYLDEFGIWKGHGLTDAEVTALYDSGSGLQHPFIDDILQSASLETIAPVVSTTTSITTAVPIQSSSFDTLNATTTTVRQVSNTPTIQSGESSTLDPSITAVVNEAVNVTVNTTAEQVTLTTLSPEASVTRNVTASATIQSVASTQLDSTVSTAKNISSTPTLQSGVFAQLATTVTTTRNKTVSADIQSAGFTQNQVSISTIDAETITLTTPQTAALTTLTPTVSGQRNVSTSVAIQSGGFAQLSSVTTGNSNITVTPTIQSSAFSQLTPTITAVTVKDTTVSATLQSIIQTQLTPTVSVARNISTTPTTQSSAFATLDPTITAVIRERFNITISPDVESVTSSQLVSGVTTNINSVNSVGINEGVLSQLVPTASTTRNITTNIVVQSMTFTQNQVSISTIDSETIALTTPQSATFATIQPTVSVAIGATISASCNTMVLSQPVPEVNVFHIIIYPVTISGAFSQPTPTVRTSRTIHDYKHNAKIGISKRNASIDSIPDKPSNNILRVTSIISISRTKPVVSISKRPPNIV